METLSVSIAQATCSLSTHSNSTGVVVVQILGEKEVLSGGVVNSQEQTIAWPDMHASFSVVSTPFTMHISLFLMDEEMEFIGDGKVEIGEWKSCPWQIELSNGSGTVVASVLRVVKETQEVGQGFSISWTKAEAFENHLAAQVEAKKVVKFELLKLAQDAEYRENLRRKKLQEEAQMQMVTRAITIFQAHVRGVHIRAYKWPTIKANMIKQKRRLQARQQVYLRAQAQHKAQLQLLQSKQNNVNQRKEAASNYMKESKTLELELIAQAKEALEAQRHSLRAMKDHELRQAKGDLDQNLINAIRYVHFS